MYLFPPSHKLKLKYDTDSHKAGATEGPEQNQSGLYWLL